MASTRKARALSGNGCSPDLNWLGAEGGNTCSAKQSIRKQRRFLTLWILRLVKKSRGGADHSPLIPTPQQATVSSQSSAQQFGQVNEGSDRSPRKALSSPLPQGGHKAWDCYFRPNINKSKVASTSATSGPTRKEAAAVTSQGAPSIAEHPQDDASEVVQVDPVGVIDDHGWIKCRSAVLDLAHSSIMGGHLATGKTKDRVMEKFFWPGITKDIERYCKSCDVCQRTVDKAVDIVGPIEPRSSDGSRYILTVVDFATRYPEAVALQNIDTASVAEALVNIFSRVGIPREVLSDRGTQFTSAMMQEVYREVPQASTKFSPFELVYGHAVRGPMTLLRELFDGEVKEPETRSSYEYVISLRERLEDTCPAVVVVNDEDNAEGRATTIPSYNQRETWKDVSLDSDLPADQRDDAKSILQAFGDVLTDVPAPTTKKEVRSFMGLSGYYRRFVPDYATIAAPLNDLVKKNAPNRVKTDASDVGLGAVLLQEDADVKMPVAYASRKLSDAEKKYSVVERECLAVVWATKKFYRYLYGQQFYLETDHRPITYLDSAKTLNGRLMRWAIALQEFRMIFSYIKGTEVTSEKWRIPRPLSRYHLHAGVTSHGSRPKDSPCNHLSAATAWGDSRE
ncbi:putative uncharacterized protein K02A2.6-like [Penaeus vannamei]|uniref:RNA-directed DNA polymerase n=1 Tax=Penaeus vannamei TaxID=6689 RepID=A0A423SKK4_PENVA|nr:putative uncharacterized protein K02A2.6-like [Penaeus vannamei]